LIGAEANDVERHTLIPAGLARRLQTGTLELIHHVGRGLLVALATGVAAGQRIVGERLHVPPPAFGGVVRFGGEKGAGQG